MRFAVNGTLPTVSFFISPLRVDLGVEDEKIPVVQLEKYFPSSKLEERNFIHRPLRKYIGAKFQCSFVMCGLGKRLLLSDCPGF